jgi:hypothetical protein
VPPGSKKLIDVANHSFPYQAGTSAFTRRSKPLLDHPGE